jgi:hypothetical protein
MKFKVHELSGRKPAVIYIPKQRKGNNGGMLYGLFIVHQPSLKDVLIAKEEVRADAKPREHVTTC